MTSSEAIRQEREYDDNPIEAEIAQRFAKITEKLKAQPHDSLTTTERETRAAKLLEDAEVPKLHRVRKVLINDQWKQAFEGLKAQLGGGIIIALIGVRGCGKTQIGASLCKENCERLRSARFTTAMDIFLAIKSTYRKEASADERGIVEDFCKPRLLVIDEIQERAESPWEDRILTHLINRRYNDEKDTVLIGNITREQFTSTMGASIVSRLNETGGIVECNWESFRK